MKKILSLVLVVMLAVTAVFAETVVKTIHLGEEEYTFLTDTEYKAVNVGSHSDDELMRIMIENFPSEIAGKHYVCIESAFTEPDAIVKKYPRYWLISEDESLIIVYNSLSDGRMAALAFTLTEH